MKKVTLLIAVIFLVGMVATAFAQPYGRGMGKGMGQGLGMHPAVLASLNLTPEQTDKIRALRESMIKETIPLRTQLAERRAELKLLWMQMDADADSIKAKQKEIHDLNWQIREKSIDKKMEFRSILTPEQLSRFLSMGSGYGFGPKHGKGGRHGKRWGQEHRPGGQW